MAPPDIIHSHSLGMSASVVRRPSQSACYNETMTSSQPFPDHRASFVAKSAAKGKPVVSRAEACVAMAAAGAAIDGFPLTAEQKSFLTNAIPTEASDEFHD